MWLRSPLSRGQRGPAPPHLRPQPVNDGYLLNPGDEILVRIYSAAVDIDDRFVISRDGLVVLPKVGPVRLAGVQAKDIEAQLKRALSRVLTDFNLFATVGRLRDIDIYVVGQAARPGKQLLGSLDLCQFPQTGNARMDPSLQQGEVIHIRPAGPKIALMGATNQAAIRGLKDWSQVISQLGLGAVAVQTLRQ